jgi:ribose transport system substrate-binding protein
MVDTGWEDSYTEGYNMLKLMADIKAAGTGWTPKAVEVPAVLVTKDTVDAFLKQHPDTAAQ